MAIATESNEERLARTGHCPQCRRTGLLRDFHCPDDDIVTCWVCRVPVHVGTPEDPITLHGTPMIVVTRTHLPSFTFGTFESLVR